MEDYKKKYEQSLEKVKAYDNALNWMRSVYPTMTGALKEDAEHYFPELKDSEDEKIRKFLIKCVQQPMGTNLLDGIEKDDVIAWLKKQGEQKSVDNLRWNELTWKDINTIEEIINEVHSDFRNGIGAECFGEEVLERFKEIKGDEHVDTCIQKPTWSEEDETRLDSIKSTIRWAEASGYDIPNIEKTNTDAFIEKAARWIENNLPKYSELTDKDEYGNKLKEPVMNVFYGKAVKDFINYMKGE